MVVEGREGGLVEMVETTGKVEDVDVVARGVEPNDLNLTLTGVVLEYVAMTREAVRSGQRQLIGLVAIGVCLGSGLEHPDE